MGKQADSQVGKQAGRWASRLCSDAAYDSHFHVASMVQHMMQHTCHQYSTTELWYYMATVPWYYGTSTSNQLKSRTVFNQLNSKTVLCHGPRHRDLESLPWASAPRPRHRGLDAREPGHTNATWKYRWWKPSAVLNSRQQGRNNCY